MLAKRFWGFDMSGYRVNVKGSASFMSVDLMCAECGYAENRSIDVRGCENDDDRAERMTAPCPNCDGVDMERVFLTSPTMKLGDNDPRSDANIAKYQRHLKERFIKKEVDDVRHKHGALYDDAVRSVAAQRIKKGEKPV
jgi:hypothetical protein